MCTLTFIPLSSTGFVLTSSRDENPARVRAIAPKGYLSPLGHKVLFPMDVESQGTWLLTSESWQTICLLNGGYEAHIKIGPYRHSRGRVIIDYLAYATPKQFIESYNFSGLEPFTLIIICEREGLNIYQITWDGLNVDYFFPDATEPQIWSSSTLYSPEIKNWRTLLFKQWLSNMDSTYVTDQMYDFHAYAGAQDPENAIRMKRASVETVSITSIEKTAKTWTMTYHDLSLAEKNSHSLVVA